MNMSEQRSPIKQALKVSSHPYTRTIEFGKKKENLKGSIPWYLERKYYGRNCDFGIKNIYFQCGTHNMFDYDFAGRVEIVFNHMKAKYTVKLKEDHSLGLIPGNNSYPETFLSEKLKAHILKYVDRKFIGSYYYEKYLEYTGARRLRSYLDKKELENMDMIMKEKMYLRHIVEDNESKHAELSDDYGMVTTVFNKDSRKFVVYMYDRHFGQTGYYGDAKELFRAAYKEAIRCKDHDCYKDWEFINSIS